jgi:hypothetical protein
VRMALFVKTPPINFRARVSAAFKVALTASALAVRAVADAAGPLDDAVALVRGCGDSDIVQVEPAGKMF